MQQDYYHRTPMHRARVAKRRRQRRTFAIVVFVLIFILLLIAIAVIISNNIEKPAESVAPPAPSAVVSSSVVASAPPVEEAPVIPPVTDAHGVAGLPPLFNYANYIPDSYVLDLVDVGGGQSMQRDAASAFLAMSEAASADGVYLAPVSGYRSHEQQQNNYNASIQNYLNQGIGQDEAVRLTELYYAIPGTSEHEAGLAMDIGVVDDSFAQTAAYDWLQAHCTEYGFINRYRQDQTEITHIAWEPWHYRFVGTNHAALIEDNGLTLEEYLTQYDPAAPQVSSATGAIPNI